MTDRATIINVNNPFDPAKNRKVEQPRGGFTIRYWVDAHPELIQCPVVCIINGEPILRVNWGERKVVANDVVVFFKIPEGGGAENQKRKNPLLAVIGIAIAVVGAVLLTGPWAVAVVSAGILLTVGAIGAGLLGSPNTPSVDQGRSRSPTYSLTARGNNARLGESIPVIYGEHLIYPDFAAQPYTEYVNNEQFLHLLLVVGQGQHEVNTIRIDDSLLSSYDDAERQIVHPGQDITLFDDQVIASAEITGQELKAPNDGGGWVGPFVLLPYDSEGGIANEVDRLDVDIAFPQGLGYVDNASGTKGAFTVKFEVQYSLVYKGVQLNSWIALGTETITTPNVAQFQTAVRRTFKYPLNIVDELGGLGTAGVQVRMRRITNKDNNTSATIAQQLNWVGAKVHYTSPEPNYGDITMLAVKLKASDSLSGSVARKINVVAKRKIPIWSPTSGWSAPTFTNSPVWAIMDMLKAQYGGRLNDTHVDLQDMYDLAQYFEQNNYTFNGVFDRKMSLWEALRLVCRSNRCAAILQAGKFQMIRDRLQTIPVAMFSPRNMVKDSFSVAYSMPTEDTADGVVVEYVDPYSYKPKEVQAKLGGGTPIQPAKVKLFGCTNRAQALREANYLTRNDAYRRKTISFTTELEGYIPTFGDLIVVSHDMPEWGISGDVVGIKADGTIVLSEPVVFGDGNHYIAFRTKVGGVAGPFLVVAGENSNEVILSGLWQFTRSANSDILTATNGSDNVRLYYGTAEERTHFSFGLGQTWSQQAVVKSIRPRGDLKVQIEALSEDARVHND